MSDLNNEEIVALIQSGKAFYADLLIRKNINLVRQQAHKYNLPGSEFEDRVQDGCMGMLEAANLFDASFGTKFSTYCVPWIRARILGQGVKAANTIHLPHAMNELKVKMAKFVREVEAYEGVRPTLERIAEHVGKSVEDVKLIIRVGDHTVPTSLDAMMSNADGDEMNVHDLLGGRTLEEQIAKDEKYSEIARIIQELPPTEQYIIGSVLNLNGLESRTFRGMDGMVFDSNGNRMGTTAANQMWIRTQKYIKSRFSGEIRGRGSYFTESSTRDIVVLMSKSANAAHILTDYRLAAQPENLLKSIIQLLPSAGDFLRNNRDCVVVVYGSDILVEDLEDCAADVYEQCQNLVETVVVDLYTEDTQETSC